MADTVQCPRCGGWNPLAPLCVTGKVSHADGDRVYYSDAQYPVTTGRRYETIMVIKCGGCEENFVAGYSGGRAAVFWPLPGTSVPPDLPAKVGEAYKDARLALAAGSKIGALMAGRTTLIRLLMDNKQASSFKELVDKHIITPALYGGADQLRLWADVVGHEDITTDALKEDEVRDILDYLGTVLEAVYTHQARVSRFVAKTKQLKSKPPASS